MMLALLGVFTHLVSSSVKMTSIIRGNWSFSTIFPPDSQEFEQRFIVEYRGDIANYLFTQYGEEIININVSFVDLSGNFTYLDQVYDFHFTMKARPYISTDIDLYEYGTAHCTFCSYSSMHCLWLFENNTYSIYGERENLEIDKKPWYIRHKNNVILGVAFVVIVAVFHYATNKLQKSMYEDMLKEAEEKKRKEKEAKLKAKESIEEEEDKEDEDKEDEDKEDEDKGGKATQPTQQIPDENGKIKTD